MYGVYSLFNNTILLTKQSLKTNLKKGRRKIGLIEPNNVTVSAYFV